MTQGHDPPPDPPPPPDAHPRGPPTHTERLLSATLSPPNQPGNAAGVATAARPPPKTHPHGGPSEDRQQPAIRELHPAAHDLAPTETHTHT